MPPPAREGRGNNARSMGFPDPFGGFDGRPGFFTDMFDNDPFFSDPFFMRPFNSPFGSTSLFGPGAPFGSSFGSGGLFGPSGFFHHGLFNQSGLTQPMGNLLDRRSDIFPGEGNRRSVHVGEGSRRGVHIEELPDDHDIVRNGQGRGVRIEELSDDHDMIRDGQPSSNQEPVVEHPDDDDKTDAIHQQASSTRSANSHRHSRGAMQSANSSGHSYSFQSSSVMYGGSNGPYYVAQTTRRQGPGGVFEEDHQERDTISGREAHRISHGLGDKGRSMTRKRNGGQDENLETLHNIRPEEVQDFEKTWATVADKNLPKRTKNTSQRLGSSSRAQSSLPSNGPRSIGWKTDK